MRWTQIAERAVDDVTILYLRGRMMLAGEEDLLLDKIRQLLGTGRTKIVLNLVDVPYVDSLGVGSIVRGYTAARQAGGTVKLCGVHEKLLRLLQGNRLDSFLETFESEADAVNSFRV